MVDSVGKRRQLFVVVIIEEGGGMASRMRRRRRTRDVEAYLARWARVLDGVSPAQSLLANERAGRNASERQEGDQRGTLAACDQHAGGDVVAAKIRCFVAWEEENLEKRLRLKFWHLFFYRRKDAEVGRGRKFPGASVAPNGRQRLPQRQVGPRSISGSCG